MSNLTVFLPVITLKTPVISLSHSPWTSPLFHLSHLSITHSFLEVSGQPGQHLLAPCTHFENRANWFGHYESAVHSWPVWLVPATLAGSYWGFTWKHSSYELMSAENLSCAENTVFSWSFKASGFLFLSVLWALFGERGVTIFQLWIISAHKNLTLYFSYL